MTITNSMVNLAQGAQTQVVEQTWRRSFKWPKRSQNPIVKNQVVHLGIQLTPNDCWLWLCKFDWSQNFCMTRISCWPFAVNRHLSCTRPIPILGLPCHLARGCSDQSLCSLLCRSVEFLLHPFSLDNKTKVSDSDCFCITKFSSISRCRISWWAYGQVTGQYDTASRLRASATR